MNHHPNCEAGKRDMAAFGLTQQIYVTHPCTSPPDHRLCHHPSDDTGACTTPACPWVGHTYVYEQWCDKADAPH